MSTPRRSYAKGLAERDEILDAALTVFTESGYDRMSVREIARQAGRTQAGLLHYFATKEELSLEILRQRDERSTATPQASSRTRVERLIEAVRVNADESGLVGLFVAMSAESTKTDSPSHSFFTKRDQWLRSEIADDVRRHQPDGGILQMLDPDDVTSLLIAVADGLQLQWLLDPEYVMMDRRLAILPGRPARRERGAGASAGTPPCQ